MPTTLVDFLTKPRWGRRDPLFVKVTDCASDIVDTGETSEYKDARSLASYIGQVSQGHKRASRPLREAVTASVTRKVSTWHSDEQKKWLDELAEIFETLERSKRAPRYLPVEAAFESMKAAAGRARTHLIITPRTAEETASRKASDIKKIMYERLGLLDIQRSVDVSEEEAEDPSAHDAPLEVAYLFCLPHRKAFDFWRSLYNELVDELDMANAETDAETRSARNKLLAKHLQLIETSEALVVYEITPIACATSVALYDPGRSTSAAFHLYYDSLDGSEDTISCTAIPKSYHPFVEEIYKALLEGTEELKAQRITWKQHKRTITKAR